MSGEPVFMGTRVPIPALFDHLIGAEPLDEFLEGFPTVTREQAETVLEDAFDALMDTQGGQSQWGRAAQERARADSA